jgi:hypothetical protein
MYIHIDIYLFTHTAPRVYKDTTPKTAREIPNMKHLKGKQKKKQAKKQKKKCKDKTCKKKKIQRRKKYRVLPDVDA